MDKNRNSLKKIKNTATNYKKKKYNSNNKIISSKKKNYYNKEKVNVNKKDDERKLLQENQEKSKNRQKSKILKFLIFILTIVVGVFLIKSAYAIFNYTKTGRTNALVVGNVYLHYTNDTISLQGVEPRNSYDPDHYIDFSIDGINEYTKSDLWYAIDLLYGDVPDGKTESNRINDEFLRFRLTKEINSNGDEIVIIDDGIYEDINNLRMYTEAIPADTTDELTHDYKLYVWISDEIKVGNTNDCDYTASEWSDLFVSIKIKIVGDYTPKGAANSYRVKFDADGGTVTVPYKYYTDGDVYGELPVATKEGYAFEGWRADNGVKVHSNKELQYNANHTLTAVYSIVKYSHPGEVTFNGTSDYIDTGVALFNEDNADRNFYISFDITQVQNTSNGTPITSRSSSNYGFEFKRNGTNNQYRMDSTGNVNSYSRTNIYYGPQNVKIIRINGIMYYSLNDGGFVECGNYTGFSNYFSNTVVFGASMNGNTPRYFFKGKLSNMMIKIIVGDDVSLDDFLYSTNKFQYDGDMEFNGSTAINTGVYLFNQANATKSFYISFDVKTIAWTVNQSTIMSSKNENGTPWPGFEFRRYGKSDTYYQSKATVASGVANDLKTIRINPPQNVRFLRVNDGSTVKLYYSINNENFILHKDFTAFNLYFDIPVVFGNAFNVEVQRYFKGTLGNMVVKIIDDSEALEICGSTCST